MVMMKTEKLLACLLFIILALSAQYSWSLNTTKIRQDDYGEAWPLTVSEARLFCDRKMVWVQVRDFAYPINGMASGGLAKLRPTLTVRPLEGIWLYNKQYPGLRIPITPLIRDGLKLCNN